jgi:hypothetical protein
MDVNVFVSSTCRDMWEDCRPAAKQAICTADEILKIFESGRAAPIEMEDWDTNLEPPSDVCRRKITEESTHYVGILGFLRGWVPPEEKESGKSITELELLHALDHCGPSCMAVFLPKDHSPIAKELQRRATELQTAAEADAQLSFHARVLQEGTAQQFADVFDLNRRVTRKVVLWAKGGLRAVARAAQASNGSANSRQKPSSDDLLQLGREEQLTLFVHTFRRLAISEGKRVAAFLVHGPPDFGHVQALARLVHAVEELANDQPRCYVVNAGVLWRDPSPAALLRVLGREVRSDWEPTSVPDLAEALVDELKDQDVVLHVSGLQGLAGGPEAFFRDLWAPLVAAVPDSGLYRLVCLASVETDGEDPLPEPGDQATHAPDPARPVVLPGLRAFTQEELSIWLSSRLPILDIAPLSRHLIAGTKGHPNALYAVLADDDLWEQ